MADRAERLAGLLRGQAALVTGAGKGIGRAVALALAEAGADVVVNYRSSGDGADEVVARIQDLGRRAFAHQADVSDEAAVDDLFRAARDRFGTLHVVVANAGIQRDVAFADMSLEDWETVLRVNLTGQFLCARAAVREFRRRRVDPSVSVASGKILCMSSVHEIIPWAGRVNYAASKGGLKMMVQSLAQEVARERIRVVSLAPGAIATDINREEWASEEGREALRAQIPYGRIGTPEDVGRAAAWLVSDEADYVTGATLLVDGGMALYPSFGPQE